MAMQAWKMELRAVIDSPEDGPALDDMADELTEALEKIRELGGRVVFVVKVDALDTISEEEFDA
jgi:hypothetical protein